MKIINKKIALGLIATISILGLGISNVSAMGYGIGHGNGMGKGNGQEIYHGNGEGKQNQEKKSNNKESPLQMLEGIDKQDVNTIEIDLLEKQYEEEIMAQELYMYFYDMYGTETFKNIAESETKHMEAVKVLLDRYDIETPTNYEHIQDLYDSLKEVGAKSEFDALEVGVKIEFVDIDDIITAIKSTDNEDIKVVLTNIGGASYNHLRGFLKAIDNNGYETELDWSVYLEDADLSKEGPIKYKLAEKLESEGVELPEQVSSESMKNKKCDGDKKEKGQGSKKGDNANMHAKMDMKKNSYKKALKSKYGAKINSFSSEKSKLIIKKIDELIEKTKKSDKLDDSKINIVALLNALKELLQEKVDTDNVNIDDLLN